MPPVAGGAALSPPHAATKRAGETIFTMSLSVVGWVRGMSSTKSCGSKLAKSSTLRVPSIAADSMAAFDHDLHNGLRENSLRKSKRLTPFLARHQMRPAIVHMNGVRQYRRNTNRSLCHWTVRGHPRKSIATANRQGEWDDLEANCCRCWTDCPCRAVDRTHRCAASSDCRDTRQCWRQRRRD